MYNVHKDLEFRLFIPKRRAKIKPRIILAGTSADASADVSADMS